MFDIAKVNLSEKAESGYEFQVKLPNGEATDFYIKVRGTGSPKVKAYGRKVFAQMQARDQQARKKNRDPEPITLDEAEEMAVDSAVIRIIDWRGLAEDGKEVKFSEENARRIMKELDWVRSQVLEESELVSNFI